eukprot:Em0001g716a
MSCQLCRNPSFATWTSRLAVDGITSTTGSVACALSRSTSCSAKLWSMEDTHCQYHFRIRSNGTGMGGGTTGALHSRDHYGAPAVRGILYYCKCIYSMHTCVYLLQRYDEELVVPIIENTPEEMDLAGSTVEGLQAYPDTCAVLVRRQGYLFRIGYEHEACLDQLPQICENHLY